MAIGLENVRSPIRSPETLERQFSLARLGILPRWTRSGRPPYELILNDEPHPAAAEAVRDAAVSVAFSSRYRGTRVLASIGRNVVLVDGDLRQPYLHRYFGLANNLGVSDFLANSNLGAADVIHETAHLGLKVITSGTISHNPAGLLASPRMDHLWERLSEIAHLVLVDTPPIRATANGTIIASQVQGVVLLVNGDTSRPEVMRGPLAKLEQTGTPMLEYVWNRISPRRLYRYSSAQRYFQGMDQKRISILSRGTGRKQTA